MDDTNHKKYLEIVYYEVFEVVRKSASKNRPRTQRSLDKWVRQEDADRQKWEKEAELKDKLEKKPGYPYTHTSYEVKPQVLRLRRPKI